MILSGHGLYLRPITPDDAALTFKWRNPENIEKARWLHKGAQSVEAQRAWIQDAIMRKTDENFIIWLPEPKPRCVGMISLLHSDEITGELARELMGETVAVGTVFEAEMVLLDYAFETLKLHRVELRCVADNDAVLKVRRYLGWHEDGRLRENFQDGDAYRDTVVFSLLKLEYRTQCKVKMERLRGRQNETPA